jgi:hypothetical protein
MLTMGSGWTWGNGDTGTWHSPREASYSNSISKLYLRWLVLGSSTYVMYAFVAFLAALISSTI